MLNKYIKKKKLYRTERLTGAEQRRVLGFARGFFLHILFRRRMQKQKMQTKNYIVKRFRLRTCVRFATYCGGSCERS